MIPHLKQNPNIISLRNCPRIIK